MYYILQALPYFGGKEGPFTIVDTYNNTANAHYSSLLKSIQDIINCGNTMPLYDYNNLKVMIEDKQLKPGKYYCTFKYPYLYYTNDNMFSEAIELVEEAKVVFSVNTEQELKNLLDTNPELLL